MGRVGETALNLGLGTAIVYLSAHALTGSQGLGAYLGMQADIERQEAVHAGLVAEQERLELAAARLREEGLDLDYLDERARILLAGGREGETVFRLDP
jgi:cell division protein FtsB